MNRRRFLAAATALLATPLHAAPGFWAALADPQAVVLMRHALAPGIGDPAGFDLGDCSTQRNLDARGRAQARATGQAFRENGIAFDHVFTGQWCRCRETAELLDAGPVTEAPTLNSFFRRRGLRAERTQGARDLIARTPGRRLLVTHQVNITALTGRGVGSGELFAIRPTAQGTEILARFALPA